MKGLPACFFLTRTCLLPPESAIFFFFFFFRAKKRGTVNTRGDESGLYTVNYGIESIIIIRQAPWVRLWAVRSSMGPIVGGPMTYSASKRVDLRHLTRLRARRRESYLLPNDGSTGDEEFFSTWQRPGFYPFCPAIDQEIVKKRCDTLMNIMHDLLHACMSLELFQSIAPKKLFLF